ncbi:PBS lyase heat domain-containing protein repeat-containing protein [Leucobacter massiliensis]|uniref:PBS lyase heat domain-containing protein repeat-containing protein n=1 Tax=Leucobacter massiliensis TaxID=1686285 RepID=A0A2S9QLC0_9MICO|nr:PBS lyase heat domain-containing protein repeat-containing protein [Leucobacter massiliensis]PRI10380.1 PBS lyase heat domain-containing protein repeat-containing protein [Leucobacter massiliensis]
MRAAGEWQRMLESAPAEQWPGLLEEHSGLPGPRANLELLAAAARLGDVEIADRLLAAGTEYAAACAAAILARRAASPECERRARALAAEERWRVRMGVEIGLQLLGDEDPDAVRAVVARWSADADPLVLRAAVAALCEPRLLRDAEAAAAAVDLCGRATRALRALPAEVRAEPGPRALRQALGYCWSVAVAADPAPGLAAFRALDTADRDVAWIVRENGRKQRLRRLLETEG